MGRAGKFLAPLITRVADQDVDRIIRSLSERIGEITLVKILSGRLIENIDVTTAGTTIFHGLSRTPHGVIIVKSDSQVSYKHDSFNATDLTIYSGSGTRTISIWVF